MSIKSGRPKPKKTDQSESKLKLPQRIRDLRREKPPKQDPLSRVDLSLMYGIQPQGGLSFRDEKIITASDAYIASLHVIRYPKDPNPNWLLTLTNIENTIVSVDISEIDADEIQKDLNKTLESHQIRQLDEKDNFSLRKAMIDEEMVAELIDELIFNEDSMKLVKIRIFLSAVTRDELEKNINTVKNNLSSQGFQTAVLLNENLEEWRSLFLPYREQLLDVPDELKRYGSPIDSGTLAYGNPFHFNSLADPIGAYLGYTRVGGAVFFDPFFRDQNRTSFNMSVVGKTGSGKSTLLKLMIELNIARGELVRGFDKEGEYETLIRRYGGAYIALGGSEGIINPLQVFRSDESELISYQTHLEKVTSIYTFLAGRQDGVEKMVLEELLNVLYSEKGLDPQKGTITGRNVSEYPIFSDLLKVVRRELYEDFIQKRLRKNLLKRREDALIHIEITLNNVCESYGNLLNRHSTIENLDDEQIVYFNINAVSKMKDEVFNALLYNSLMLCYENLAVNGITEKYNYDMGLKDAEDIRHTLIFFDEAHRIINTKNTFLLDNIIQLVKEDRKYFGSIVLATQSIRDFINQNSSDEAYHKIKTIFEEMQYRFIFKQDTNTIEDLDKILGGVLTPTELNQIPRLSQGDTFLIISGDRTLQFHVDVSQRQLDLFRGGI